MIISTDPVPLLFRNCLLSSLSAKSGQIEVVTPVGFQNKSPDCSVTIVPIRFKNKSLPLSHIEYFYSGGRATILNSIASYSRRYV